MTPLLIFNRPLSDAEHSSLAAKPFQIFRACTWRDKLKGKLKDLIYFATWRLLPTAWARKFTGESDV